LAVILAVMARPTLQFIIVAAPFRNSGLNMLSAAV
jgi:hypothetical protein